MFYKIKKRLNYLKFKRFCFCDCEQSVAGKCTVSYPLEAIGLASLSQRIHEGKGSPSSLSKVT